MNKAFIKDIFKEIFKTYNRFLAIFAIVALCVGFFAGLKATTPTMKKSVYTYFDENHLMDIHLLSTTGFTESDINALKENESLNLSGLSATSSLDALVDFEYGKKAYKFIAINNGSEINQFYLTEGRMQENEGECVIDSRMALGENAPGIGSVIELS